MCIVVIQEIMDHQQRTRGQGRRSFCGPAILTPPGVPTQTFPETGPSRPTTQYQSGRGTRTLARSIPTARRTRSRRVRVSRSSTSFRARCRKTIARPASAAPRTERPRCAPSNNNTRRPISITPAAITVRSDKMLAKPKLAGEGAVQSPQTVKLFLTEKRLFFLKCKSLS